MLIKKYKSGSQMNNSFDNNKLVKRQYTKESNELSSGTGNNAYNDSIMGKVANDSEYKNYRTMPSSQRSSFEGQSRPLQEKKEEEESNMDKTVKVVDSVSGAVNTVVGLIPIANVAHAAAGAGYNAKDYVKKDDKYGEGRTNAGGVVDQALNFFKPHKSLTEGIVANEGNTGKQLEQFLTEGLMINTIARGITRGAGTTDIKTGGWGAVNRMTGDTAKHNKVDADIQSSANEAAADEAWAQAARDLNKRRNLDRQNSANLLKNSSQTTFKSGGKLIPKTKV